MDRVLLTITQSPMVRWFRDRPLLVDLGLGVLFGGLAVIVVLSFIESVELSEVARRPERWWEWLMVIGPAWLIPFRRTQPVATVLAGALLQALVWAMEFPDTYLAMAVLNYSAAAHGGVKGRWASWLTAVGLTTWTLLGVISGQAPIYTVPIVGVASSAAVSLGIMVAGSRAQTESAEAKADHLERTRASDRERAIVEERARIARELHDVVAHGLSVIVVQAAAAQRILDKNPEGAGEALSQIEHTGRNALSEMRHVLAAIRTEPEESWQPAPGLTSLEELVSELSATGLHVTVTDRSESTRTELTGDDAIPATVSVTAYRIVQEALTNVLKHAGRGARATVNILRREQALDLEIIDDGRGAKAVDGGGHGLRGMQERVEVFGGRFAAGPKPHGGFAVSVTLPFEARESPEGRDRAGTS